jgi:hypothetical protein
MANDREQNLDSIGVLREWLDCVEKHLRAGGDPAATPQYHNYEPVNVDGKTDPVFDGVPMATLESWLNWWQKPERTWCGGEEAGRDPATEAERVRLEIEARRS